MIEASSDHSDLILAIDAESETLIIDFDRVFQGRYEITLSAQDESGLAASAQFFLNVPAWPLPDRKDHVATIREIDQLLEIGLPSLPGVSQILQTSPDGFTWTDTLTSAEQLGDNLRWRTSLLRDDRRRFYRVRFVAER